MGSVYYFSIYRRKKGGVNMDMCNEKASLSIERMNEIEEIVNKILLDNKIDFKKAPTVDIVSLVKKDGFKVKPTDMPIDTTGCLVVNGNGKNSEKFILVNKIFKNPDNETDVIFKKSRFITAHEYGHYVLKKQTDCPLYAHRDSDKRDEPEEIEADYFARSILMPLNQFRKFYHIVNMISNNNEEFVLYTLSKLFKVTSNKVRKRMEDLAVLS